MEDPKVIYLGPACQKEGDGREWCEDDVWTQCECGCSSVRYMLESDAQSELASLREELDGYRAANMVLRDELKTERLRSDAAVGDANDAERSLTAAEQRNAELVKLLDSAFFRLDTFIEAEREMPIPSMEVLRDAILRHCPTLQPTESGASE